MSSTTSKQRSLPGEILLLVTEQLPMGDLPSFLRVNSAFHRVGLSALLKPERPVPAIVTPAGATGYTVNGCLHDEEYAGQVRSVTVEPHAYHWCSEFDLHDMPKVEVIRVYLHNMVPYGYGWRLLHDDDWKPFAEIEEFPDERQCSLLDFPSARTLVIAEAVTLEAKGIKGLLTVETVHSIDSTVLLLTPNQLRTARPVPEDDYDNSDYEPDDKPVRMDQLARFAPDDVKSFTLVYQSPQWVPLEWWEPEKEDARYPARLLHPAYELILGIFNLFDDLGYNGGVANQFPESLERFSVVVPDGVFNAGCQAFFQEHIDLNLKQYGKQKMPAARILTMSQLMSLDEYAGVMTEKELATWRRRADLPHYELTVDQIQSYIIEAKGFKHPTGDT